MPPIRLRATYDDIFGIVNTNIQDATPVGSGTPNFLALPVMSRQMPPVSTFASRRALSANSYFTDPLTGVSVLKVTDATTDTSTSGVGTNYSEGGPFISQRWGGTKYTMRLGPGILIDIDKTGGTSNRRSMPSAGDTSFGFSMNPATPQLAYYLSNSSLFAYDTATNANVAMTHIPIGGRDFGPSLNNTPYIEWLTVVQDDWMTFQASNPADAPFGNKRLVFFNALTGETVITICDDNNQLHPSRDGSSAFLATNNEYLTASRIWRRATNDQITITGANGGHPAALIGAWVDINPQGGDFFTTRFNLTGTAANVTSGRDVFSSTGTHHAGQYPQPDVPLAQQYYLSDSQGQFRSNGTTWNLNSGQIYSSVVDWNPRYQKPDIGITGVFQYSGSVGSRVLTHTLTEAANFAAMTEGSFWYDAAAETVYVWCFGGGSPLNRVQPMSSAGNALGLAFIRADGLDGRILVQHGNYNWTSDYYAFSFGTWSPDGLVSLFRSSWGLESGRMDFYVAFSPEIP